MNQVGFINMTNQFEFVEGALASSSIETPEEVKASQIELFPGISISKKITEACSSPPLSAARSRISYS
ncbi:MAG: hypothetical protein PHR47_00855 [Candidatus Pacebacteria bacterium]|nr:hypothetical protein [Candidatus Paceibacterota bacterium]